MQPGRPWVQGLNTSRVQVEGEGPPEAGSVQLVSRSNNFFWSRRLYFGGRSRSRGSRGCKRQRCCNTHPCRRRCCRTAPPPPKIGRRSSSAAAGPQLPWPSGAGLAPGRCRKASMLQGMRCRPSARLPHRGLEQACSDCSAGVRCTRTDSGEPDISRGWRRVALAAPPGVGWRRVALAAPPGIGWRRVALAARALAAAPGGSLRHVASAAPPPQGGGRARGRRRRVAQRRRPAGRQHLPGRRSWLQHSPGPNQPNQQHVPVGASLVLMLPRQRSRSRSAAIRTPGCTPAPWRRNVHEGDVLIQPPSHQCDDQTTRQAPSCCTTLPPCTLNVKGPEKPAALANSRHHDASSRKAAHTQQ
jgi:hypothetical protein